MLVEGCSSSMPVCNDFFVTNGFGMKMYFMWVLESDKKIGFHVTLISFIHNLGEGMIMHFTHYRFCLRMYITPEISLYTLV